MATPLLSKYEMPCSAVVAKWCDLLVANGLSSYVELISNCIWRDFQGPDEGKLAQLWQDLATELHGQPDLLREYESLQPVYFEPTNYLSPERLNELSSGEASVLNKWCEVLEDANWHSYLEHISEDHTGDYPLQEGDSEELDSMWSHLLDEIKNDAVLHQYASTLNWDHFEGNM
jgi:hypothetical protein